MDQAKKQGATSLQDIPSTVVAVSILGCLISPTHAGNQDLDLHLHLLLVLSDSMRPAKAPG